MDALAEIDIFIGQALIKLYVKLMRFKATEKTDIKNSINIKNRYFGLTKFK